MSITGQKPAAQRWNSEQLAAIAARSHPAIITAGAGSGKTGVLVECVVQSIVADHVDPRSILAVTFTNKAAAQMKNRIRKRLAEVLVELHGEAAQLPEHDPVVETIDAYCHRLLTSGALEMGLDPEFKLLARGAETARFEQRAMDAAIGQLLDSDQAEAVIDVLSELKGIRAVLVKIHNSLMAGGVAEPSLPEVDAGEIELNAVGKLEAFKIAAAATAAAIEARVAAGDNEPPTVLLAIAECARAVLFESDAVTAEDVAAVGRPSQSPNANKVPEIDQFDSTRESAITALAEREMLPHYETLRVIFERFTAAARELKLEDGVVTFADVELLATELLARERDAGIKPRFSRVFVDEFQDVNALQQRLVELVSGDSYYAVGDAAQSIYGFRGSEVELIRNRERELAGGPGIVELRTNYRSVAGVLEVNNRVHGERGVKGFKQLEVGSDAASPPLPVELIAVDVGHEDTKSLKAKDLEDAAIAIRIKRLIDDGEVSGPGDIAVLARARTALPGIADALRRIGVSAVIEGGGGLWDRPEIDDIVALLAITGNPNDEERLLKVLRSPMAGLSVDALVLLARAARRRKGGGSIWLVARDPQGIDLAPDDAEALASFVDWFTVQREFASRRPIGDAIEACLVETGYDLHLLGLIEGERRFANVRALQMFAAQWEAEHGRDLRAFADEAAQMAVAEHADDDQEAVVEQDGDSSGSVRLLTMHGSKGLEFDTVVLPRLGSNHRGDSERLRVSSDGTRALMTRKVGKQPCVLFDQQLAESQSAAAAEERERLLYVAMTRAERKLIVTSAVKATGKGEKFAGARGENCYIAEIQPYFAPKLLDALNGDGGSWVEPLGPKASVSVTVDRGEALAEFDGLTAERAPSAEPAPLYPQRGALNPALLSIRPTHISYSGLQMAADCSYRWYAESIVGLPHSEEAATSHGGGKLSARVRGAVMHALLEEQQFGGAPPTNADAADAADRAQEDLAANHQAEVVACAAGLIGSPIWQRLSDAAAAGATVRREEGFTLLLDCGRHGSIPLRGVFDVFARVNSGSVLVVDWKTSDGAADSTDLESRVAADYLIQREAYALAALSSGGRDPGPPEKVEVVHVYAERPDKPVIKVFESADCDQLKESLAARVTALLDGGITVTDRPWYGLCHGCPARDSICPHPRELTEASRAH